MIVEIQMLSKNSGVTLDLFKSFYFQHRLSSSLSRTVDSTFIIPKSSQK